MGKSLGDYNIEQSSSYDIKNIKWTQKNSPLVLKNQKITRKPRRIHRHTNIIHSSKIKKSQLEIQFKFLKIVIINNKNLTNKKENS